MITLILRDGKSVDCIISCWRRFSADYFGEVPDCWKLSDRPDNVRGRHQVCGHSCPQGTRGASSLDGITANRIVGQSGSIFRKTWPSEFLQHGDDRTSLATCHLRMAESGLDDRPRNGHRGNAAQMARPTNAGRVTFRPRETKSRFTLNRQNGFHETQREVLLQAIRIGNWNQLAIPQRGVRDHRSETKSQVRWEPGRLTWERANGSDRYIPPPEPTSLGRIQRPGRHAPAAWTNKTTLIVRKHLLSLLENRSPEKKRSSDDGFRDRSMRTLVTQTQAIATGGWQTWTDTVKDTGC